MKNIRILFTLSVLLLQGCGPRADFKKARSLEKNGFYVEASMKYDKVLKTYPDSPLAPEALYRIARIYQKKIKVCSHAQRYFQLIIDQYPGMLPWSELAKSEILNCPDYYPLTNGSFWIEGDSATGGKNMRAEWACKEVSSGTFCITRKISAGSRLVTKIDRYFRKMDLELREYIESNSRSYTILYSFPLEAGREWKTIKDGRELKYRIAEKEVPVKVVAGDFSGCVKISEQYTDLPGSRKFNYYAPEVGWVLTTTSASGGQEFRSSELISYKIMPETE